MNFIRQPRKVIVAFFQGCWATLTGQDIPDAGVKVEPIATREHILPTCGWCGLAWPRYFSDEGMPPGDDLAMKDHSMQCSENPLVKKLEAAANTFSLIESICGGSEGSLDFQQTLRVGELATKGYRAAKN